jgi:hypothetical protein
MVFHRILDFKTRLGFYPASIFYNKTDKALFKFYSCIQFFPISFTDLVPELMINGIVLASFPLNQLLLWNKTKI